MHTSLNVAIAGATTLRGKDLKDYLEESGFPAGDIRLLDEELAAGTLTEVAGEAALVQAVDEDSFQHMRFVFFTGSAEFALRHGPDAERAGATVIDLTGALAGRPGARRSIPRLDALLAPPEVSGGGDRRLCVCVVPGTPAILACSLAAALEPFSPSRLAMVFFYPVSERGADGIEELQKQTVNLLSLQSMPQEVFDTQVAFNLLPRWGSESAVSLGDARAEVDRQVRGYLAGRCRVPAISLVQAPVFFGQAFSAYAEFPAPLDLKAADARLQEAGFTVFAGEDPEPSNISVAGNADPAIRRAERDPGVEGGYWFWGASDNMRLASVNAVRIAEKLLAS